MTPYFRNIKAMQQQRLLCAALSLAGYRMRRQSAERVAFDIWKRGTAKKQGFCTLAYDGSGKGIGQWWKLTGVIPQQVKNVVETCVKEVA